MKHAEPGYAISINQDNLYLLLGGAIILILVIYTISKIKCKKHIKN